MSFALVHRQSCQWHNGQSEHLAALQRCGTAREIVNNLYNADVIAARSHLCAYWQEWLDGEAVYILQQPAWSTRAKEFLSAAEPFAIVDFYRQKANRDLDYREYRPRLFRELSEAVAARRPAKSLVKKIKRAIDRI